MSTQITVVRGDPALIDTAKRVQEANRAAQLQRERDQRTEAKIADAIQANAESLLVDSRPIGGNPDTSVDRRPSAQRKGGTVFGAWLDTRTTIDPAISVLRVGTPNFGASAEANYYETSSIMVGQVPRGRKDVNASEILVLPAGAGSGVFVYVQNTITTAAVITPTSQLQSLVATAYEIFPFLVTADSVTQLTVPDGLRDRIEAICPPISPNTTQFFSFTSATGVTTTITAPWVDEALWKSARPYGNYAPQNAVLARSFGTGRLNSSFHGSFFGFTDRLDFYSPAIYDYLTGELNLLASSATEYAAMREQLNPAAPRKFLAPCVQTCSTNDTEFYVTTTQPSTIFTPVPAAVFKLDKKYTVDNGQLQVSGGPPFSGNYYCWDWDKPAYCRQRLFELGFTPGDLKP